jgi:hypothetical protein
MVGEGRDEFLDEAVPGDDIALPSRGFGIDGSLLELDKPRSSPGGGHGQGLFGATKKISPRHPWSNCLYEDVVLP